MWFPTAAFQSRELLESARFELQRINEKIFVHPGWEMHHSKKGRAARIIAETCR